MGDAPLPGDFKTLREVVQEASDDEDQVSEMDEDPTYTTSMNTHHTPASPSALPSPPFSRPSSSSVATNSGTSWIPVPSPHAMGLLSHHSPAPTWYDRGVYNNNSHNSMTTDTWDSNNDSSINIGDSE